MATVRRPKWHPPPPQTPRILHLPRPARRRKSAGGRPDQPGLRRAAKGKLEALFGQERTFCYTIPPASLVNSRRVEEEVEERDGIEAGVREEKWKFQAEILRAECKFLRMEREIACKRLERERAFMEKTLKSAVHALISAKRKIGEGENAKTVLEEEIEELARKLGELRGLSNKTTRRDPELLKEKRSASSDFDKGATLLQKQLQRIGGMPAEKCERDVREIAKASLFKHGAENQAAMEDCDANGVCHKLADVEILRRKMEGLSRGKLLKMEEEYGLILSRKQSSTLQLPLQETRLSEQKLCTGQCKALVRRMMEQVRAETEQWSQMQEMLGQVREEMEELQASRDYWEGRAHESDCKLQTLNTTVQDWKQNVISLEIKEKKLQDHVKMLQEEIDRARREKSEEMAQQPQRKEKRALKGRVRGGSEIEEMGEITREAGGNRKKAIHRGGSKLASPNRLPFLDIGNRPCLVRQTSRRSVFPLQSPQR